MFRGFANGSISLCIIDLLGKSLNGLWVVHEYETNDMFYRDVDKHQLNLYTRPCNRIADHHCLGV